MWTLYHIHAQVSIAFEGFEGFERFEGFEEVEVGEGGEELAYL